MNSSGKDKELFDHFVLTKFNVRESWSNQRGHLGLKEDWLERRFDLFERGCLASVAAQTEKSFQWLVFFDEATPEKFVKRVQHWDAKHPFFTPIYCKDRREEFVLDVLNRKSSPDRFRIMTNLDNDDLIHPRMIENIQRMARTHYQSSDLKRGFFILFPLGYSECVGDYYIQRFRYNPFNSFVSVPHYTKSILGWDHTKIVGVAPIRYSYTTPMWCQVVHGENLENNVRGLYWPWGYFSQWLVNFSKPVRRPFFWQCAELWRSFRKYVLGK